MISISDHDDCLSSVTYSNLKDFRRKHEGVARRCHLNFRVWRLLFANDTRKQQQTPPPPPEQSSVCSTTNESRGPHPATKKK